MMKHILQQQNQCYFDIVCHSITSSDHCFFNTISLSRHEQVCLIRLRFERYFSHHLATEMIILRIFKGNMRSLMETIEEKKLLVKS